jgi:hypothetical protein
MKLPRVMAAFYSLGSVEEAMTYCYDWQGFWASTAGAVEFLRAATA